MTDVLIAVAVILVVCGASGTLAERLGQPRVVGEFVGAIALGPTVLGSLSDNLFPDSTRPALTTMGNLGVVLFILVIGLEFARESDRSMIRRTIAVTGGATLVPFAVGVLGTVGLSHLPIGNAVIGDQTTVTALFVGVALSVTAFPVLARILADRGIAGTTLGRLAMSVAASCDVIAWTALAGIIALAGVGTSSWLLTLLGVPYVGVLRFVVRPLLRRILPRCPPPLGLALIVGGGLASAAATEAIGLHFTFGAFAFGLSVPHAVGSIRDSAVTTADMVGRLFIPVYFTMAGLSIDARFDWVTLAAFGIVFVAAVASKVLGTVAMAVTCGMDWRSACTLGVLVSTRGLTELVVLTTGLQLGLIGSALYTALAAMALATTVAVGPALNWLRSERVMRPANELSGNAAWRDPRRAPTVGAEPP